MMKPIRLALLAILVLGVAGVALAATEPTRHQIYEAAQAGRLAEAQRMIDQVLQDYPRSAEAHFVAAQLDARIGDLVSARQQLATARQLDPSAAFTSAPALSALERQLTGLRTVPAAGFQPAPVVHRSSLPWGLIGVLLVGAFVLWSVLRGRARQAYGQGMLPPGNPGLHSG